MHAIERALERYGVELTREDLQHIEEQIRLGRAILVGRGSRGARRYLVCHGGVVMRAVWIDDPGMIVTFIPLRDRFPDDHRRRKLPRGLRGWRRNRQEREASHAG